MRTTGVLAKRLKTENVYSTEFFQLEAESKEHIRAVFISPSEERVYIINSANFLEMWNYNCTTLIKKTKIPDPPLSQFIFSTLFVMPRQAVFLTLGKTSLILHPDTLEVLGDTDIRLPLDFTSALQINATQFICQTNNEPVGVYELDLETIELELKTVGTVPQPPNLQIKHMARLSSGEIVMAGIVVEGEKVQVRLEILKRTIEGTLKSIRSLTLASPNNIEHFSLTPLAKNRLAIAFTSYSSISHIQVWDMTKCELMSSLEFHRMLRPGLHSSLTNDFMVGLVLRSNEVFIYNHELNKLTRIDVGCKVRDIIPLPDGRFLLDTAKGRNLLEIKSKNTVNLINSVKLSTPLLCDLVDHVVVPFLYPRKCKSMIWQDPEPRLLHSKSMQTLHIVSKSNRLR